MESSIQQKIKRSKKLSSSALQLTLVISLVISILLGCLIYLYYFYKQQESRFSHTEHLLQLMDAGIALSQSKQLPYGSTTLQGLVFMEDSVRLHKERWGMYDLLTVNAYYARDSSAKAFFLGLTGTDSTVLYVADEDRNLSVSGKTRIVGEAFLPRSGIRPSFVDGVFFQGKEEIVEGKKSVSDRELPSIQAERISQLWEQVKKSTIHPLPQQSTNRYSFLDSTHIFRDSLPLSITAGDYQGRIILFSDSAIYIDAASDLQDIICIAPVVHIEKSFHGRLQVLAKDSIILGDQVQLDYPSALILWSEDENRRRYIRTGNDCSISGSVLLYEAKRSRLPHLIDLGQNNKIRGDLVAFGMLRYKKPLEVIGSTYCYRFITQTPSAMYENFLIDINIDRQKLNPFFLHGQLWTSQIDKADYQILKWLD